MMVGTLFNTVAVAVGASVGLTLGARWSDALKRKMFVVLGLFTLAIGASMAMEASRPIDVVGCMEDGLMNKPDLLLVKGTMDLISSAFLAATLGRGVLWSALGVLGFQGLLTFVFAWLGQGMEPALIMELSALGGILMLGIGLQLLGVKAHELKQWPLVDALPSLFLLPFIRMLHDLIPWF